MYEKKYPITHLVGEHVLLVWERGYYKTTLYYKDRIVAEIQNLGELKRGVHVNDPELGDIELKFSEKPISVDIIINGYHCTNNVSHPKIKIKSISTFFYIIASLSSVYLLITFLVNLQIDFSFIFDVLISITYFIVAYNSSRSKIWAVYTGFLMYLIMSFLILLNILLLFISGGDSYIVGLVIGFIIRITLIVLMIPYLKLASSLKKHQQFLNHARNSNFQSN